MNPETLLQAGDEMTRLLLYRVVYFIALVTLGSMIILAFHVDADYYDGVYWLLGTVPMLCFAFSWGGEHFTWPIPGLIWLLGILLLAFMLGLFLGWLLPWDADVVVRRPPPERN